MVSRYRFSCREIKQSVPQGSVLGPLLFSLCRNDLPLNIHGANLVVFADDINVLTMDSAVCALQRKIDRAIAELEIWFNRNNLTIIVGKTELYHFTIHNQSFQ